MNRIESNRIESRHPQKDLRAPGRGGERLWVCAGKNKIRPPKPGQGCSRTQWPPRCNAGADGGCGHLPSTVRSVEINQEWSGGPVRLAWVGVGRRSGQKNDAPADATRKERASNSKAKKSAAKRVR